MLTYYFHVMQLRDREDAGWVWKSKATSLQLRQTVSKRICMREWNVSSLLQFETITRSTGARLLQVKQPPSTSEARKAQLLLFSC